MQRVPNVLHCLNVRSCVGHRVLVIEDVLVKGERNPRERQIHVRHAKHGLPANPGASRGLFRSQAEWIELMQSSGHFTVTRVGAVVAASIDAEFRHHHRLAKTWNSAELTGPTYQRYFVAERCTPKPLIDRLQRSPLIDRTMD